jgi:hypothetical protein
MKMRKLLIGLVLYTVPAQAACHHYSTWNYPYPQPSCGRAALAARNDSNWYVEIKPETEVVPGPTEPDTRTPDQIKDFIQHNIALSLHHDELDDELNTLLQKELTTSELKGK